MVFLAVRTGHWIMVVCDVGLLEPKTSGEGGSGWLWLALCCSRDSRPSQRSLLPVEEGVVLTAIPSASRAERILCAAAFVLLLL